MAAVRRQGIPVPASTTLAAPNDRPPTVSEPTPSKRERQKQRRQERLHQQQSRAKTARRNRLLVLTLIAVLILGVVGYFVQDFLAGRQQLAEAAEAAAAKLDDLGCTEAALQPDQGAGHLPTDPASLAAAPPDELYDDRPTSSGPHIPQVLASGVYDVTIDERLTTHNLEHGYIVYWYDQQADPAQVEQLKAFAQEQLDGEHPKIIVAPWNGDLPEDLNFASVAWEYRQMCQEFDSDVALTFLTDHYENERAPERFIAVHSAGGQGVLQPEGEPLLFPPLDEGGQAAGSGQATEDPTATPGPGSG